MPGRASYSRHTATFGPPVPARPTKAVSSPFELRSLSTPPRPGRGPDDGHPSATCLGDGSVGPPGAQTGGGADVVTAGVADAGQGVVREAHGDVRSAGAGPPHDGGVEPVRAALDVHALPLEDVAQQVVGVVLGEVEL